MAKSARRARVAQPFLDQVVAALRHIDDPGWLGAQAPLASPYVLGTLLAGRGATPLERGRVLQQLLLQATELLGTPLDQVLALSPGAAQDGPALERLRAGTDQQRVLYWRYFQPQRFASTEHLIDAAGLNVSRTHFFYLLDKAQEQLAAVLARLLRPALRPEVPPAPPALIGRREQTAAALETLGRGGSVYLCGPAGVGKTALATHLSAQLAPGAAFWYTLRPGVNTTLSSLLYELAVFLAQRGAANLWHHLVALGGAIPETAVAVLRFDLAQLSAPVLLCVDELDLRTTGGALHTELLDVVQALRGYVPLLLVGQQLVLEADAVCMLDGFGLAEASLLLAQAGLELPPEQRAALQRYTGGNPRLLHLCVDLHRAGVAVEELVSGAGAPPQIGALLERVVRRLSDAEREALQALAAYDRPAPDDLGDPRVLEGLAARRLVQRDGPGQVSLVPALRGALALGWEADERHWRHLAAARVRETRGETVAAMHHYLRADAPDAALLVWLEARASMVAQGQGAAALELLRRLPAARLPEDLRLDLGLEIGRLELLVGRPAEAAEAVAALDLPPQDPRSAWAHRVAGSSAELRSRLDEARAAYLAGLRSVTRLAQETSLFHKNLSWTAMRQRDLDESWREACLARCEAVNMQGYVREEQGDDAAAQVLYLEALALAQEHGFRHAEAKTCNNLARLAARRQQAELAEEFAQRALDLFQTIGDLPMVASVRVNLALAANQSGQPQAALEPAAAALAFFQQSGQRWGALAAAQNLAEAHLALGQLDQAEAHALLVVGGGEPKTLPDGLRVLGEIALERGQTARALRPICAAVRAARRSADRFLEAYAWRALGRALLARGKPAGAGAALDRADTLFAQLQMPQEQALTAALRPGRRGV